MGKKNAVGIEFGKKDDGDIIHIWPINGPLAGRNGYMSAEAWINVVNLERGRKRLVFIKQRWSKLPKNKLRKIFPRGTIIELGRISSKDAVKISKELLSQICQL